MSSKLNLQANLQASTLVGSLIVLATTMPAYAQSAGQSSSNNQSTTTLRNPLIQGVIAEPPGTQMPVGQVPAVGSGSTPNPVNPGMEGISKGVSTPLYVPYVPANQVNVQNSSIVDPSLNPIENQNPQTSRSMIVPYVLPKGKSNNQNIIVPVDQYRLDKNIPAPPSNPGAKPAGVGILYTHNQSNSNFVPPATVVQMGSTPGITGTAQVKRWSGQQAQQSHDFGLGQVQRNAQANPSKLGSQTTDFGQDIKTLRPVVLIPPISVSYDGPRSYFVGPQQDPYTAARLSPPRTNAQEIQDLYGTQRIFKTQPSTMTVAPF